MSLSSKIEDFEEAISEIDRVDSWNKIELQKKICRAEAALDKITDEDFDSCPTLLVCLTPDIDRLKLLKKDYVPNVWSNPCKLISEAAFRLIK